MNYSKTIYTAEYKSLIVQLKKARQQSNLSQTEVSQKLGVTQSFISKVEAGQYRLDIIQLKQFARLYNKKLTFFLKEN
ncbi:MAG: helix-turn-helix transcriptional regulator [Planctomycetes bacterium]|nr:helix-turn-helix transcriptional regulator [Planctomycetota bacterium]